MASEIFICRKCYDPQLMQWEEYTSSLKWKQCILCGAENAEHWFVSARYIIKKLIERVRALEATVSAGESRG